MGLWFKDDVESSVSGVLEDVGLEQTISIEVPMLEREADAIADVAQQIGGNNREMSLFVARTKLRGEFAQELTRQFERAGIPKEYQPEFIRGHAGVATVSIELPRDPVVPVSPEAFERALNEAMYRVPHIVKSESPRLLAQLSNASEHSTSKGDVGEPGEKGPKKKTPEELAEEYAELMESRRMSEWILFGGDGDVPIFTVKALATVAFVAAMTAAAPGIAMASAAMMVMPKLSGAEQGVGTTTRRRDDEFGI